jgi:hypothetical protein
VQQADVGATRISGLHTIERYPELRRCIRNTTVAPIGAGTVGCTITLAGTAHFPAGRAAPPASLAVVGMA